MKKIDLVKLEKQVKESISADLEELEAERGYHLVFSEVSDVADMATITLPLISAAFPGRVPSGGQETKLTGTEGRMALLRRFVTSSGIYGFAAVANPLVSLVLTPFLAHALAPRDYGVLALINTAISLMAGITQLGLSSAFFRAYNYDYLTERDRSAVLVTTTLLLCLTSIPVTLFIILLSPLLAQFFVGNSAYAIDISLAGGVVFLQNLTVPGLAWKRSEDRPLSYSLLSLANLLGTLLATILLVGVLGEGIAGAIIANGLGYACIVVCTFPLIFFRRSIKLRFDIARSMLLFGGPLVLNFVAYWILQLSDRYLLSLLTSLEQAAKYTVAYTLGSVMAALIIGPFTLAWPTAMFTIAKREDAAEIFRLVFRGFSSFLLFAAFGLSIVGIFLLGYLFPSTYYSAAPVIPIVAVSHVFYGIYYIFTIGINLKRKTWFISFYTCIAAILNVGLNLVLIPQYGSIGAAVSTLLAYVVLVVLAYLVNQRIYPLPFGIGYFGLALLSGILFYLGSGFLASLVGAGRNLTLGFALLFLCFYGGCLVLLSGLPLRKVRRWFMGS